MQRGQVPVKRYAAAQPWVAHLRASMPSRLGSALLAEPRNADNDGRPVSVFLDVFPSLSTLEGAIDSLVLT